MGGPAAAHCRLVVDEDVDAGQGDRGSIEIEGTMKLHPGGETQVDA